MVAHGDIIPDLYSLLLFYRDCNADLMENQSMSPSIYFETGLGMYKTKTVNINMVVVKKHEHTVRA